MNFKVVLKDRKLQLVHLYSSILVNVLSESYPFKNKSVLHMVHLTRSSDLVGENRLSPSVLRGCAG